MQTYIFWFNSQGEIYLIRNCLSIAIMVMKCNTVMLSEKWQILLHSLNDGEEKEVSTKHENSSERKKVDLFVVFFVIHLNVKSQYFRSIIIDFFQKRYC